MFTRESVREGGSLRGKLFKRGGCPRGKVSEQRCSRERLFKREGVRRVSERESV